MKPDASPDVPKTTSSFDVKKMAAKKVQRIAPVEILREKIITKSYNLI